MLLCRKVTPISKEVTRLLIRQHAFHNPAQLWRLTGAIHYFSTSAARSKNDQNEDSNKRNEKENDGMDDHCRQDDI
ncbi:hypothetical protein GDO81_026413 [Engystomops pustulosus]|uniref:Uncharacterized protein n=1 Tax=Engystomops pustulosus TaxID=76066 RepID=A0AAV6YFS7_ENGPU|nr:hypothetical protein GDO81_026413 [Engystomops pustulosus]